MPSNGEREPRRYEVIVADAGDADLATTFVYLCGVSPQAADRWQEGIFAAIDSLSVMPQRCGLAPENDWFEADVRQLLHRHGASVYRILFSIFEQPDAPEGLVRVQRILHGARHWLP